LLADDDKLVRRVTERQLQAIGFEVLATADGTEAVQTFARDPERIQLALLDMTMPGMSGAQVAQKLLAVRPQLPIVFFSGYDVEDTVGSTPEGAHCTFLAKPFTLAELERVVTGALGGDVSA
jgi:two-component system cell cycle sensor histidine kinase/response regulator CckA